VIFRPTVESDLDRILPLIVPDPACDLTGDVYRARLADGQYRPGWTWIGEDASNTPLAVAIWWGNPGDAWPSVLVGVFVHAAVRSTADRPNVATELLTAAHAAHAEVGAGELPEYHRAGRDASPSLVTSEYYPSAGVMDTRSTSSSRSPASWRLRPIRSGSGRTPT
jgi:hypothetical protein